MARVRIDPYMLLVKCGLVHVQDERERGSVRVRGITRCVAGVQHGTVQRTAPAGCAAD